MNYQHQTFRARPVHFLFPAFLRVAKGYISEGISTGGRGRTAVSYLIKNKSATDPSFPRQWRIVHTIKEEGEGKKHRTESRLLAVVGTPHYPAPRKAYLRVSLILKPGRAQYPRVNNLPNTFQPPSAGWHRRCRRNGTANQY